MVFPDHTACTDQGNIVGGEGRGGGGGVQAHPPQVFFCRLNLKKSNVVFFSKKTIIFQDSRGVQHFPGGGVQLSSGGGGVQLLIPYKNPNK